MIHGDMSIEDVVKQYPETLSIFKNYGLECAGCKAALFKNIAEGALVFGIDLEVLLNALNKAIKRRNDITQ
ncbi:MAG TPA: DUF1858 domain-containing protein [Syntrophorhabdaceae bacterium]|nr:DUF1858 domain-containing protein [Syntrophorhabdaceae bacterium]